ncbi:conjugal transfer protein TraF [Vibrio parahaemolyticus]|nr:conjugal transfer protein TraF [Vibrio parahaemolyticus]
MRIMKVVLAAVGALVSANAAAVSLSGGNYYGVASLEGARAALINPALLSAHDGNFVDVLAPRVTVQYSDQDDVVGQTESLTRFVDKGPQDAFYLDDIEARLKKLSESNRIEATGGFDLAAATSLPFGVGGAAFVNAQVLGTAVTNLGQGADSLEVFNNSSMDLIGLTVMNVGVAGSYAFEMPVGELSVGLAPKIQTVKAYGESINMRSFDFELSKDSKESSTQANVDLGFAYSLGPVTLGLAGKNLVPHEIELELGKSAYDVSVPTQYTAGVGFDGLIFRTALDVELNEYEMIDGQGGTQKAALSGEVTVVPMLSLRAAYIYDISTEEHVTAFGAGVNLFPRTQIDVDAGLSNEGDIAFGLAFNVYL